MGIYDFKEYSRIYEEETKERSREEFMSILVGITDSIPYRRLYLTFFSYGIHRMLGQIIPGVQLTFREKDILKEFQIAIEMLNPSWRGMRKGINIILDPDGKDVEIYEDNDGTINGNTLVCKIPKMWDKKMIIKASLEALKEWITYVNFGEEGNYRTEFIQWWMNEYLFDENREGSPSTFIMAFVGWLKTVDPVKGKQAYLDILNNSKKSIQRWATRLGTIEELKYIEQLMGESHIDYSDVRKGSNIISRFNK